MNCFNLINHELKAKAIKMGKVINSWDIYAGTRRVASLASTTVYGTTRGGVNLLLYEEALNHSDQIKIFFNHKVTKVDAQSKTLTFQLRDQPLEPQTLVIDAS